jgi:hypothetical protein
VTTYIAGPMTALPDLNYPAFDAAAAELRAEGVDVLNPAEQTAGPDQPWEHYMRLGLASLLRCDSIVLLPGWTNSKGAKLEYHVACSLGMRVSEWSERA